MLLDAELKKNEATASSQLFDWRNAHDRVADEAVSLRATLAKTQVVLIRAQETWEHEREMKHQIGVMLARAMIDIRSNARTVERLEGDLQELTSAAQDAVNAIAPPEGGADPRSLVKRLRATPGTVAELCKTFCK